MSGLMPATVKYQLIIQIRSTAQSVVAFSATTDTTPTVAKKTTVRRADVVCPVVKRGFTTRARGECDAS